jgi:hypothetical protein
MSAKKPFIIISLLLCLILVAFPIACTKQENAGSEGPKDIDFYTGMDIKPIYSRSKVEKPHSKYEFAPALQGDIVKHDFIIENNSDKPLELRDAEGCCGCLVEGYTQSISPGMAGAISAVMLTDSRGGEMIEGTIRVRTNDPDRPEVIIDVVMEVKEFADLNPYRIWLKGSPGETIIEKCTVIPNENYPFNITGIKTRKGVWFDYSYKEIENNGRKGYEITVINTREKPGPYQDVLFVQTDHPARPEFKIRIEGRISE